MLKTARKIVLASALVTACGVASAVPVTDTIDPTPDLTITTGSSYLFTHNITDGLDAFVVGFDTITSAVLSIHLIDFLNKGNEEFSYTIGSGNAAQTYTDKNLNNGVKGAWFEITLGTALQDLIANGKLNVLLSAATGSYEFADSILTAEITRGVAAPQPATPAQPANPASVPEPGSLLLLGAGLLGIGMTGRSALRKSKTR